MTGSVLLPGCSARAWSPGDDYERIGGLWVPPSAAETHEAAPAAKPIGIGLFAGAGGKKREQEWHAQHRDQAVTATEFFDACRFVTPGDKFGPGDGWIAHQPDVLPCEHYYLGDIRAITGAQILNDLGLESDDIAAVIGGPPCQGFSRAGKQDPDDARNELVFEFMRVVIEIHPQTWVMENVTGMLEMVTRDGIPVIDAISLMAADGGMGTFEAIRRSLHETSGVGAALRTKTASGRRMPPGLSGGGHFEKDAPEPVEDDQLSFLEQLA